MKKLLKFLPGGKTLPTAPPAEQRYKGGKRVLNSFLEFGDSVSVRGVEAPSSWYEHPAQIVERIRHSKVSPMFNDTVYAERPSFIRPIHGRIRAAGNDYYYGKKKRYLLPIFGDFVHFNYEKSTPEEQKEYDTLKRRFNTAWSVSSKQEGGTIDEPSGKFNNALFNLGIGAADSGLFASMLHKDGGVLKGQGGMQFKENLEPPSRGFFGEMKNNLLQGYEVFNKMLGSFPLQILSLGIGSGIGGMYGPTMKVSKTIKDAYSNPRNAIRKFARNLTAKKGDITYNNGMGSATELIREVPMNGMRWRLNISRASRGEGSGYNTQSILNKNNVYLKTKQPVLTQFQRSKTLKDAEPIQDNIRNLVLKRNILIDKARDPLNYIFK